MKNKKIRIVLLAILLVSVIACEYTVHAAKQGLFEAPLDEEQMLVWLKEHNYEVKKIGDNRYSISWVEDLPNGQISEIIYGTDICKVIIESVNNKNTARFTFPLSLGSNPDVSVSSKVVLEKSEEIETIRTVPFRRFDVKTYRYSYVLQNLQNSQKPATVLQVYYTQDIPTNAESSDYFIGVNNPSQLWENSGSFELAGRDLKSVIWRSKDTGIFPGKSQHGFAIQAEHLPTKHIRPVRDSRGFVKVGGEGGYETIGVIVMPGIITARVDVDNKARTSPPLVKIDGKDGAEVLKQIGIRLEIEPVFYFSPTRLKINGRDVWVSSAEKIEEILLQSCPQGKIIGPETIPEDSGILALIQRLETLTSQCVSEGWLNENTSKTLKQHLIDSKTALQNDQEPLASLNLEKFVKELMQMEKAAEPINSSQKHHLTQEASTLLGTNALYLINTIKSRSQ